MEFLNKHKKSFMVALTLLEGQSDYEEILNKKDVFAESDLNDFFNDLVKLPVNYKKFGVDAENKLPYPRDTIESIIRRIKDMEPI